MDNNHKNLLKHYADQLVPSSSSSKFSGGTSQVLGKERGGASFRVEDMVNLIDGGQENTARKRFIRSPIEKMDFVYRYSLDRPQLFADVVKEFIALHKKFPNFAP